MTGQKDASVHASSNNLVNVRFSLALMTLSIIINPISYYYSLFYNSSIFNYPLILLSIVEIIGTVKKPLDGNRRNCRN